jgi:hypothetical protein
MTWKLASVLAALLAGLLAGLLAAWPVPAAAQHACDALGEAGWRTVASVEVAAVRDGAPYRDGADWLIERTTTLLPLCNYINAAGNYSLRSYSLDPMDRTERIVICRAGAPVPPYGGPCPPEL